VKPTLVALRRFCLGVTAMRSKIAGVANSPQTYVGVNFPSKAELSPGIGAICKYQLQVVSATERITELPR